MYGWMALDFDTVSDILFDSQIIRRRRTKVLKLFYWINLPSLKYKFHVLNSFGFFVKESNFFFAT